MRAVIPSFLPLQLLFDRGEQLHTEAQIRQEEKTLDCHHVTQRSVGSRQVCQKNIPQPSKHFPCRETLILTRPHINNRFKRESCRSPPAQTFIQEWYNKLIKWWSRGLRLGSKVCSENMIGISLSIPRTG